MFLVLFFTCISCDNKMSEGHKTAADKTSGLQVQNSDPSSKEGLLLIGRNNCKSCHNKTLQAIGPSYVAIAQKYPNTPENVSMLTLKVKNGGTGVWGKQVMTPHPELDDTDIIKMVRYILSLDDQDKSSGDSGQHSGDLLPDLKTKYSIRLHLYKEFQQ